jgi:hypothetical protein
MTLRSLSGRRAAAVLAATAAIATTVFVGMAQGAGTSANEGRGPETYSIGLFGDMPYNELGRSQYPNLLADINQSKVAFSIFDGDLKAGADGPCSDSLYTTSIASFNTLERPLVWLPGDNDWTDCWGRYGPSTLPYSDPIERLHHERELFDSTGHSLGKTTLKLTRESAEGGAYALYSENVRWQLGPVVYLGLNVQGSNDNFAYHDTDPFPRSDAAIAAQQAEEVARKAANLHWLSEGFAYAKQVGAKGVLIDWQADPNFNNEEHLTNPHDWDAYADYVSALTTEVSAFSGQVALVHGDSHYFKIDKPLNGANGGVLANFTRVETFGARNTHWVKATIDPKSPNLFEFEPQIVPANVG